MSLYYIIPVNCIINKNLCCLTFSIDIHNSNLMYYILSTLKLKKSIHNLEKIFLKLYHREVQVIDVILLLLFVLFVEMFHLLCWLLPNLIDLYELFFHQLLHIIFLL